MMLFEKLYREVSTYRIKRFFVLFFQFKFIRIFRIFKNILNYYRETPFVAPGEFFKGPLYINNLEPIQFPACETPRVSIIIPVYNQWMYTYKCLWALSKNTGEIPFEVIVIDDQSSDETPQVFEYVENFQVIRNEENLGFLHSCNHASEKAQGEFILFLNNDTEVTEGWLSALLEVFENDDQVGIAGAKLVFPYGKLQEAGGIVWSSPDQCPWNFGRGEYPNHWEYNYVKEVDYCSGACLMVRRTLFEEAGKFDSRYVPAYYEDTDLAMTIREMGWKVVYQPESVVLHWEGVTGGTNTSSGTKQFQLINQNKFYKKWQTVLEDTHCSDPGSLFLARDRSQDKKIVLYIDHYVPEMDKDAGSFITFQYLKVLKDLGYKIIFWPDNLTPTMPYTLQLQKLGIEVIFGAVSFRTYMIDFGKFLDAVIVSRPITAEPYLATIRNHSKAPILYMGHDLHYVRMSRRAEVEDSSLWKERAQGMEKLECSVINKSDVTLIFGDYEKDIIEKRLPGAKVQVLPWIQPVYNDGLPYEEREGLIFIGGFGHFPNVDGLLWFAQEVLPILRKTLPDVPIRIVGSKPPPEIEALAEKGLEIMGHVPDVAPLFQQSRVFMAPLRFGAGVKGKILLAMGHHLPVVTTTVGAEGIGLSHKDDIRITDDPKKFAEEIVSVYRNKKEWENLSQASEDYVRNHASPETARRAFGEAFELAKPKQATHAI